MFSTPETSVHMWDKNREISPLERKFTGERIWKKASFKTRMEDPMRYANHRFRSRVGAWEWRRVLWGGRLTRNAKRWRKFVPYVRPYGTSVLMDYSAHSRLTAYLHTVFQAIIPSHLAYALPSCGPLMTLELLNRTDAFLKRSYQLWKTCLQRCSLLGPNYKKILWFVIRLS